MSTEEMIKIAREEAEKQIKEHIEISDVLLNSKLDGILGIIKKLAEDIEEKNNMDREKEQKLDTWKEKWGERLQKDETKIEFLQKDLEDFKEQQEKKKDVFEKVLKTIVLVAAAIGGIALIGYIAYQLITRPVMHYNRGDMIESTHTEEGRHETQ